MDEYEKAEVIGNAALSLLAIEANARSGFAICADFMRDFKTILRLKQLSEVTDLVQLAVYTAHTKIRNLHANN